MALSQEKRRELLALHVPESRAVRDELNDYLARTGLHFADFAKRINYSPVTLRFFLEGRYQVISSNDKNLRVAIRTFIDANPIGSSFGYTDVDDESKLYCTQNVRLLEKYFREGLEKPLARYVYGPPGTQKSFILKRLIQKLVLSEVQKDGTTKRAFYVYCRVGICPIDLMKRVAEATGIPGQGNVDRILRNIRYELRKKRSLICFDEAQHLDKNALEVVRELLDEPPYCSLLFAGSHNLKQIFQQVELEQWRSRLHEGAVLPGISYDEAREIIAGELGAQPAKKITRLIEQAQVNDFIQGKDFKYISARKLFWGVREIKAALAERNVSQA